MIRKSILFLALFCLALPMAFAQQTQEKNQAVVLQWKFQKGEVLRYEQKTTMKLSVQSPMQNMDGKVLMQMNFEFKVKDVDENGTATISARIKRIRGEFNMGPMQRSFDSNNKSDLNTPLPPQFGGLSLKDLIEQEIQLQVDKSGKVQVLQGGQGMAQSFSEIFFSCPMGPMPIGASWTKNLQKQVMNSIVDTSMKFTLKKVFSKKDGDYAQIDVEQKLKMDLSNNPMAKTMKIEVKKAQGTGTILFNLQQGKLHEMKTSTVMVHKMSGDMGGQKMEIDYSMNIESTIRRQ